MHGPMTEDEGELGPETPSDRRCKCGEPMTVQSWDSHCGGFTDWKYTCTACSRFVWVEGIDS